MKDGIFAIYRGSEYEVGFKEDGSFILRSQNNNDVNYGFSLYKGLVYAKVVQRAELQEIYEISTFAEYKSIKFRVIKEDEAKVLLCAMNGDYKIFENIGMEMVDRGVYHKWVDKKDVAALYEEKKPI